MVGQQDFEQGDTAPIFGKGMADSQGGSIAQFAFFATTCTPATGAGNVILSSIGQNGEFFFDTFKIHGLMC
ncbi:hypothetical protein HMPREF1551_00684 [Capnocytophaga sp. oral taxon 863 str. F0517]|nr:hypothetical protein HMPREF1551_00684 [Capnocytophaga sp. oral taxon 863 str. F0517]